MSDDEVSRIFTNGSSKQHDGIDKTEGDISMSEDSSSSVSTVGKTKDQDENSKEKQKEGFESKADKSYSEGEMMDLHLSDAEDESRSGCGLSDSDSDMTVGTLRKDEEKVKRKKCLKPKSLFFNCEWKDCSFGSDNESQFHVHVSYHIPHVAIKTLANGEEVYMCLWAECCYLTGGVKEIQRHVTYHSYHTKLKKIGEKLVEEWKLPACMYGFETRNTIPEKIDPMICEWSNCEKEFNNVQVFLHHIQLHINEAISTEPSSKKLDISCKWEGCTQKTNLYTRNLLANHLRRHSQEKVVGCPTCGHLFSTNTKLKDHCERQLPNEMAEFQCTHCYKYFPSLRLLKDHMRGHVNFYKCCYCEMTCTSRHTFSAHIRYKHLDSKPFKCNLCEYSCKTQQDLKMHVASHDPNDQFECEEAGCDFTCRTKRTFHRHMIDDHQISNSPVYCCHVPGCISRYKRGCYLTKHLMQKHCLRWPAGHSKFMYHRQEDGTYKLQTVRYESIKLYGQNKPAKSPPKGNFKLSPKPGSGNRSFNVFSVETDANSNSSTTCSGLGEVLISIEDHQGNTINCCTAPEIVTGQIPRNATIIASGESDNNDCENKSL